MQERPRDRTEKPEEGERGKAVSPPQKKKKFGIILVALAAILLLALAAAVKLGFAPSLLAAFLAEKNVAQGQERKEPEYMYAVPEILVNLSGDDRRRFLSVRFYLGYDEAGLEQELERRMPEIRDAVNRILWEKTADEIATLEGKEALRKQLFEVINSLLNSGQVRGVYFWHVLIQ